jgi:hypothetical protein
VDTLLYSRETAFISFDECRNRYARWEALLLGAEVVWPAWYALIRFTEWHLDVTRPISLRIT